MKNVFTLIIIAAIILLGCQISKGQTKPDSLKHYSGYKFALPCAVKRTVFFKTTVFNLVDTAGLKHRAKYKAWDQNTGAYVTISEGGLKPVKKTKGL